MTTAFFLLVLVLWPWSTVSLQSLEVRGRLSLEAAGVELMPACYAGIQAFPTCRRKSGTFDYAATEAYNAVDGSSSALCLQCCSNLYKGAGERVDETWDLECEVTDPLLALDFYGYEFQFARNRHENDRGVVRCALGRLGCEYKAPDGSFAMNGKDLSCSSTTDDFGSCDSNKKCVCAIPGSQKGGVPPGSDGTYDDAALDGVVQRTLTPATEACTRTRAQRAENGTLRYLKGYTLTIEVEERSTSNGDYWRSVTSCRAEAEEVENLKEGDAFRERIRMRGPKRKRQYRWFDVEHGLFFLILGIFGLLVSCVLLVRYLRQSPCPTCGSLLIWSKDQCVACRFYELPMPDPLLLARIRARTAIGESATNKRPLSIFFKGRCLSSALMALRCVAASTYRCVARILAGLSRLLCFCWQDLDAPLHDERRREEQPKKKKPVVKVDLYFTDPVLRRENLFEKLTRRISPQEHKIVVDDQEHHRRYTNSSSSCSEEEEESKRGDDDVL